MPEKRSVEGMGYTWAKIFSAIGSRKDIGPEAARWAMEQIMSDRATDAQIAGFGLGLKMKGATAEEVGGLAETMLSYAQPVEGAHDAVDIVGTGGDGANTVNISTMASLVVAGAGVPVIKHGNRAASSKSGGADVLEELGITIGRDSEGVADDLREVGIGFCFAPIFHPALRFAGGPRRELGAPTIFNALGPLTNPGRPGSGLIGCAFEDLFSTVAHTFAQRGDSVLVVRGSDGLDEITITGDTEVAVVGNGTVSFETIHPESLGFSLGSSEDIRGGDAVYNAEVARTVWSGAPGPVRDAVLLNAAGALVAYYRTALSQDLTEAMARAVTMAAESIDSGAVMQVYERWAQRSSK